MKLRASGGSGRAVQKVINVSFPTLTLASNGATTGIWWYSSLDHTIPIPVKPGSSLLLRPNNFFSTYEHNWNYDSSFDQILVDGLGDPTEGIVCYVNFYGVDSTGTDIPDSSSGQSGVNMVFEDPPVPLSIASGIAGTTGIGLLIPTDQPIYGIRGEMTIGATGNPTASIVLPDPCRFFVFEPGFESVTVPE